MNKQRDLEVSQFIIADEELSSQPNSALHSSAGPSNSIPTSTTSAASTGSSSTPFWAPKVDLSAFQPFYASGSTSNVQERQFRGGDTLDEPVWQTLRRDIVQIGRRLMMAIWPVQLQQMAQVHQTRLIEFAERNGIRLSELVTNTVRVPDPETANSQASDLLMSLDWDLWGPLVFSLGYTVTIGLAAPTLQKNIVFSYSFSFIWIFFFVVGTNIQLLGGSISFLSAISTAGYLMFPIVVGAILSTALLNRGLLRLHIMIFTTCWSIYSALMSLKCSGVLPGRVFLTIYPLVLLYMTLGWLAVIT